MGIYNQGNYIIGRIEKIRLGEIFEWEIEKFIWLLIYIINI
jgi:hypothetical protein